MDSLHKSQRTLWQGPAPPSSPLPVKGRHLARGHCPHPHPWASLLPSLSAEGRIVTPRPAPQGVSGNPEGQQGGKGGHYATLPEARRNHPHWGTRPISHYLSLDPILLKTHIPSLASGVFSVLPFPTSGRVPSLCLFADLV